MPAWTERQGRGACSDGGAAVRTVMTPIRYWSPAVLGVSVPTPDGSVTSSNPLASTPRELGWAQPVAVESNALPAEPPPTVAVPSHRSGRSGPTPESVSRSFDAARSPSQATTPMRVRAPASPTNAKAGAAPDVPIQAPPWWTVTDEAPGVPGAAGVPCTTTSDQPA